ncbi:peptidoglycan bridge formation glycyltransferase FemA/FemB family protein [Gemella sanguinis]|jgi:putative fmhA protein|uniref:peptidoglycan bridge formation glycyltransferase FemA/FemB family protein n=1 Tax=Gemella sanguinis TaxID=84135 RepID=UPI00080766C4|nr:peptidoglycan bridge formation glycyltransferase FemA/FemB family protein [Gemella sanguinis]
MIFTEISSDELQKVQEKNNDRYYLQQAAVYSKMQNFNNLKTKILAVKENDEVLAYATFIYFPYKKFFFKVTAQHGPIMDYSNTELVKFYMTELKKYFAKDFRVLCVRVNPFLNERIYKDIEYVETTKESIETDKILTSLGYKPLNDDLFTNPTLASRCIYSRELEETLTEDTLLKTVSTMAKRSINKAIKEGITVKEIDIFNDEDAAIFDSINKSTEDRINFQIRTSEYFRNLKTALGDKLHLMVSYLDCDSLISKLNKEIEDFNAEKNKLTEKLESGKVNPEKTMNKIARIDESIAFNNDKIAKITSLKEEHGNIIYLSCASFIETKQDLIYFTGGMKKEFSRFNGSYLVMYTMIKYAIRNNFKIFNFFGTSKEFTSEDATDYSVLQFKRHFNGNVEYFMDNYEFRNAIGKIWKI